MNYISYAKFYQEIHKFKEICARLAVEDQYIISEKIIELENIFHDYTQHFEQLSHLSNDYEQKNKETRNELKKALFKEHNR